MSTPADDTAVEASAGRGRRHLVVLLLAALVAAHTVVIALWLMPSDPVRDAAGPDRLARYVDPYFWQSWSSLDPSRQRVDEGLRIRGKRADGSETAWVDLTVKELDAENGLLAARYHLAPRRLAVNINASLAPLDREQARAASGRFLQDDAATALRGVLTRRGVDAAAAQQLVANDAMAVDYASMVGRALWGTDIRQVRYGVGRRSLGGYGTDADDATMRWRDFGWRKIAPSSEGAQAAGKRIVEGWRG